jgi:hypothetical protein
MILVNLCAEISCSNNHRENSMSFYLLKSESIKLPLAVKTLIKITVLSKFN